MTATRFCPQCGKPLSSDAPQGLCPACLLEAALQGQSALESETTALYDSPQTKNVAEAGVRVKYFGDYELLEEIARGGMGVVWKARQSSLNWDVALKMIRAGALASPEEVQRFLREAEAAANLQHPNIVAIHEVGEHDGKHYFSMDYVAGRDLGALVKDGPLSPQRAARYVKIIAEAIHFAHQRGTLHRDLKPQNVLIDAADQPRITDFGLAKIIKDDSRLTQTGVVMGSPSYMPSEQAAGRHADIGPASDVYSLGAVLYELLTGRPPFRGATALATLHDVVETEPTSPRRLNSNIPPDLETICLKCLEKSMPARYPTARALAEELDRYLRGEPIQARPASAVRKAVNWGRRHPGALAALAALVMVALSFGVFYLFKENAFLRAKQADPTLARVPGLVHESLRAWGTINDLAVGLCLVHSALVILRVQGLSHDGPPKQPLGERARTVAICAGLLLVGSGVVLLLATIHAHVWEGATIFDQLFPIYAWIFFGLATLSFVLRDYRRVHYGTSGRELTAEEIEPIRRAMEDFDVPAAIKCYREIVPDAGLMQAEDYVVRLAESLRGEHPGKFVPPPVSLATLNWNYMLICAVIEAVIVGVFWAIIPPPYPASFVVQLANAILFGIGLTLCMRMQGFKGALALVTVIVVIHVGGAIAEHLGDPDFSKTTQRSGILFGIFLMVAGFTRRRR
jgi:tRNA A-37 threonylcarbamoyl transferase component Bud32